MNIPKKIKYLKTRCNKLKKRQIATMDELLFNKNVSANNKQIILNTYYR